MRIRLICMLLLGAILAPAQIEFPPKKKEKDDPTIRTAQGVVKDSSDELAVGAVVQIKNLKTLQIRSFITKEDGKYIFTNLLRDADYELRAEGKGYQSPTKPLNSFDNRKLATINLRLENKIEKK